MPYLRREQFAGMGAHYMYYSFDYFLKCQQELGLKTIEIWCGAPHFLLDDYGYQDAALIKKKAEDYGLAVCAFTPESTAYSYLVCAHDEIALKHSLGYYKNGIKAACEAGAKIMPVSCCGGDWNEESERTFDRAVNTLSILAPVAADCGVTLAVETVCPEDSNILNTLPQLLRLLGEVNHPNVKAALDLTAVSVAGETMKQWFETLGGDIVHMHFTDGRPGGHLIWGDGLRPPEDFLAVMNKYGYEGYLGQKITDRRYFADPREADRRNIAALKPFFKEAGM